MMLHAEAIALEHLLVMDEKTQEPQPNLATEWSYDDSQTVLTVKLREGVKFHDGSDFTAEDAAASCEAYSSSQNVSGSWWADELKCKVIDDYTFTITPASGKPLGSLVNTLDAEYKRDVAKGLPIAVPKNYYPNDDPSQPPLFRWRAHAHLLYENWLNYYVYQNTPYDLGEMQRVKHSEG